MTDRTEATARAIEAITRRGAADLTETLPAVRDTIRYGIGYIKTRVEDDGVSLGSIVFGPAAFRGTTVEARVCAHCGTYQTTDRCEACGARR